MFAIIHIQMNKVLLCLGADLDLPGRTLIQIDLLLGRLHLAGLDQGGRTQVGHPLIDLDQGYHLLEDQNPEPQTISQRMVIGLVTYHCDS